MGSRFAVVAALLAIGLSSCSTVEVTRVPTDSKGSPAYKSGLRFYRSEPFLLVTHDEKGNPHASIVYLPNKNEEYIVKPKVRLGSVEANATLEGGWNLTVLGTKSDPKIPETITAIAGAAKSAAAADEDEAGTAAPPALAPGLYRIDFDATSGHASGLTRIPIQ